MSVAASQAEVPDRRGASRSFRWKRSSADGWCSGHGGCSEFNEEFCIAARWGEKG